MGKFDSAAFVGLTKLRRLILDGNPITKLDSDSATALASLPALTHLSLDGCSLRRLPDNFFLHFSNLENLNLAANFFTDIHNDLQHANNLKELDISKNPFKVSNSFFKCLATVSYVTVL